MLKPIIFISLILWCLFNQCSFAQWSYLGLGGRNVEVICAHNNFLYAGTDSGLYRKTFNSMDTSWSLLGLQQEQITGLIIFNDSTFISSVLITGIDDDTISFFKTTNAGENWFSYQNGFGGYYSFSGGHNHSVWDLENLRSQQEVIYAVGGAVGKSIDGG